MCGVFVVQKKTCAQGMFREISSCRLCAHVRRACSGKFHHAIFENFQIQGVFREIFKYKLCTSMCKACLGKFYRAGLCTCAQGMFTNIFCHLVVSFFLFNGDMFVFFFHSLVHKSPWQAKTQQKRALQPPLQTLIYQKVLYTKVSHPSAATSNVC